MGKVRLLYLGNKEYTENITRNGFSEIEGIGEYRGRLLRNKVVIRLDLLWCLTDYFTEETLVEYRNLIYNLIAGNDKTVALISKKLTALYLEDTQFRKRLGEIFYFDERLKSASLYQVVVSELIQRVRLYAMELSAEVKSCYLRELVTSHGYMYVSFDDADYTVVLPRHCKEEVVSDAKAWRASFTKQ